jgi:hypothetical protein
MKKFYILGCLLGVLVVPAVQAQTTNIVLYQDLNNYSYGDGGEFNAVPNTTLLSFNPALAGYTPYTANLNTAIGSPNFQTFCIETGEFFTPGDIYNVVASYNTIPDDQFPSGNPVTMGTAWLYSQFAAGTLNGYAYNEGSDRIATAGDLQQAIWYLQGDVNSLVNGSADGTAFYAGAATVLGGNINDPANGAFGVICLNLRDGNEQDQLMVVPNPSLVVVPVPEPGVLSFGLLGLGMFGACKMRGFFKKQTV